MARVLVGVLLVGNDDVAVKGILLVRAGGQRVDADEACVADVAGDGVLDVVVDDPQTVLRIVRDCQAKPTDVVGDKIEALQRLLERAADLVDLGPAGALLRAHARAAAKVVLMFLRGMKSWASVKRRSCVPAT